MFEMGGSRGLRGGRRAGKLVERANEAFRFGRMIELDPRQVRVGIALAQRLKLAASFVKRADDPDQDRLAGKK